MVAFIHHYSRKNQVADIVPVDYQLMRDIESQSVAKLVQKGQAVYAIDHFGENFSDRMPFLFPCSLSPEGIPWYFM